MINLTPYEVACKQLERAEIALKAYREVPLVAKIPAAMREAERCRERCRALERQALHESRSNEPLARTFGDLMGQVAAVEDWFEKLQGNLVHFKNDPDGHNLIARVNDEALAVYRKRLELVHGIQELYRCLLAIGEKAITLPALAKLRSLACGPNPFDQSIDTLTIPEVVARLHQEGSRPLPAPPTTNEDVPDRSSMANTLDERSIVSSLRRAGKATQAALVEFMIGRHQAGFDEVKENVHGDSDVEDSAVRKRVSETTKTLIDLGSRLSYKTASGFVFKEIPPE